MPGDRPEDVARAFRAAGKGADLSANAPMLAQHCDADIQRHLSAGDAKWPKYPPWARILTRPKGSRAKARSGATLIFSGALRQSMRRLGGPDHVQRVSKTEFAFGSSLHYATVQNDGGMSRFKPDPSHIIKGKGGSYVRMQIGDEWRMKALDGDGFDIEIRARPFCYLGPEAQYRITEELGIKIEKEFARA